MAKFYDVVTPDDLPDPFDASQRCGHEVDTESLPDGWGGHCCYRPVWDDNDRCIWHAESPGKSPEELQQAQELERTWPQRYSNLTLIRRLDETHLRNYKVDEEHLENQFERPISFNSCTLFNSDFRYSDLRQTHFQNVHLTGSNFEDAICKHALFQGCDLSETNFEYANLENTRILRQSIQDADWLGVRLNEANVHDSDFTNTNLRLAKLKGTYMTKATLRGCNLEEAELENTDLRDVDLRNAELYETLVRDVRINEGTQFGETCRYEQKADEAAAKVGSAEVDGIVGRSRNAIHRFVNRWRNESGDAEQLTKSVRVYRLYQRLLREAALPEDIRLYRVRERHARRKLALRENRHLQWLKLCLDRWVMLYGESPKRVIGTSLGVILLFAALYPLIGELEPSPSTAGQFLYFSATTFTALVYGDLQPANEIARVLVSVESFVGALLMALLVFVLGRRATW